MKTPRDINEANAEFWKRENERRELLAKDSPPELIMEVTAAPNVELTQLTPDWDVWLQKERVTVWEGVALSVNINPPVVTGGAANPVNNGHLLDGLQQYHPRLMAAVEALGEGLRAAFDFPIGGPHCLVWLHEFAAWTVSRGWWVPPELKTLAQGSKENQPSGKGTAPQDHHMSPAPVITPTSGGEIYSSPGEPPIKPVWSKWRQIDHVRLWECVALSLDINPDRIKRRGDGRLDEKPQFLVTQRCFAERLEIAGRATRDGGSLICVRSAGCPHDREVSLRQFATWAVSNEWRPCAEFCEFATEPLVMNAELCDMWARKDLWTVREAAFLLDGRPPDSHAPNDEELNRAVDDIKRAIRAGTLQIVGEVSRADRFYHGQHLRPREVIAWATGKFPKFPLAEEEASTEPAHPVPEDETSLAQQRDTRGQAAYLHTIGALLHLLLKTGLSGKPLFSSQSKLIDAIRAQFPGTYGLSQRELETKFAEAKKAIKAEKPPQ